MVIGSTASTWTPRVADAADVFVRDVSAATMLFAASVLGAYMRAMTMTLAANM